MWAALLGQACAPVFWLFMTVAVFSISLCRLNHTQRICVLPLFITTLALTFTSSDQLGFVPGLSSLWSQSVLLFAIHATSLLYIEKWPTIHPDTLRPSKQSGNLTRFTSRGLSDLWTTYKFFGNPRLILPGSTQVPKAPAKATSRPLFVFLRLTKLPIYYVFHFLILPPIFSEIFLGILPSDVSTMRQSMIRRAPPVTAREVMIRAWVAIHWIWETFLVLDSTNAVLASLSVSIGLDLPHEWPPLFGEFSSICSLRRFWACFWHQLATRPYKSYAHLLAHSIGLEPSSPSFSFVVALIVFAISGASHAAVSWQLGWKDWYLDIQWFLCNFIVCTLETLLLGIFSIAAKRFGFADELVTVKSSWLGRLISGAWVFGFFFWSVPFWKYPRMHADAQAAMALTSIFANAKVV